MTVPDQGDVAVRHGGDGALTCRLRAATSSTVSLVSAGGIGPRKTVQS